MSVETIATADPKKHERAKTLKSGEMRYRCAADEGGTANWCSIGQGAACIRLDRYLLPGRHVILSQDDRDLSGRVVWCRSSADGSSFVAGLRIFRDEPGPVYFLPGSVGIPRGNRLSA